MTDSTRETNPNRKSQRRRRRRIFAAAILFAGLALVGLYLFFTSPQRVARMAENTLAAMTGAKVHIREADFGITGRLVLKDVLLTLPVATGRSDPLFQARELVIEHRIWTLLLGRFSPTNIRAVEPTVFLTEDLQHREYNLVALQKHLGEHPRGPQQMPRQLPNVELDDGRIQFGQLRSGKYELLDAVKIRGSLIGDAQNKARYLFELTQSYAQDPDGSQVVGYINLLPLAFGASLESFEFTGPQMNWLPARAQRWWASMEPAGNLPSLRIWSTPPGETRPELHVELHVKDVALTLPKERLGLPLTNEKIRMVNGSGVFKINITDEQIEIADLRGEVEGLRCQVFGRIQGFDERAGFDVSVRTEPFSLDQAHPLLRTMPQELRHEFAKYFISGTFQTNMRIQRRQTDGKVTYQGDIKIIDSKASYFRFPYQADSVTGTMQLTNEVLTLDLVGRKKNGASMTLKGTIAPPTADAAVDLHVDAKQVPVDDELLAAATDDEAQAISMFIDRKADASLREAGLIQSEAAAKASGGTSGGFDLSGTIDVLVHITRPFGRGIKFVTTTKMDLTGLGVVFHHWPYPMKITGGTLTIKGHTATLENATARSPLGPNVTFAAQGRVSWDNHVTTPDVRIKAANLPIDPLLLATLPRRSDDLLKNFNLTGTLDGEAHVFANEEHQIDFAIDLDLRDGQAKPFAGDYVLDDVTGKAALGPRHVDVTSFTGRHGESTIALTGLIDMSRESTGYDVTIAARDMRFEDPVLDLMPPDAARSRAIRDLFARHQPAGVFDAKVRYRNLKDQPREQSLVIEPRALALDLRDTRIELTDLTGKLETQGESLRMVNLTARFETGGLAIDGSIGLGDDPIIDVTFEAHDGDISPVSRSLMPQAVLKVIDQLEFNAGYELRRARLMYHRKAANGQPVFDFTGKVSLRDASANIGLPVTHLNGDLAITAMLPAGQDWPKVKLLLKARSLSVMDREFEELNLEIYNQQPLATLRIEQAQAACYQGVMIANGTVQLGDEPRYSMDITLQDVDFGPFRNPRLYRNLKPGDPLPDGHVQGRLTAQVALEGQFDKPEQRSGRGQMSIVDADLYNLPLSLAVLQVLNMSFPSASSFDRAGAVFLIDGDTVRFDRLSLEAPSLLVIGRGTLEFSKRKLDLYLVSRNPVGLDFGPITDLLTKFKDELVSIRVTGTLDNPNASPVSLSGFQKAWQDVMGEPEPTKHTQGPPAPAPAPGSAPGSAPGNAPDQDR